MYLNHKSVHQGKLVAMNISRTTALVISGMITLLGCDAFRPLPDSNANEIHLEVAIFEGGYGIDWYESVVRQYEADNTSRAVKVDFWGDPRISEIIKPRILRGDPPDLFLIHNLPIWILIASEKLLPFTDALKLPAPGSDEAWGDLFIPGTLTNFTSYDDVFGIPTVFAAWAVWYDARMFRNHDWSIPETWDEFLSLCEQISNAGIAPIAFQGKYPSYAWFTFISLIQRCGGLEAINRINEPQPGAFLHPDVIEAARLLQEMALKHFQRGAMAMTHTESQLQFVNGNAAMIFCGLWLFNEMRESIPPDFEMRCFNVPAVTNGKGNPKLFNGQGGEFIFVPADSRNPELAFEIARYMVSPATAPSMGEQIGVLSPLRNAITPEYIPPELHSALEMTEQAPGIFNIRVHDLFLEWNTQVLMPGLASLLRGEVTPEAFCEALDAGIERAMNDPDTIIPPFTRLDPVLYGESPAEDTT